MTKRKRKDGRDDVSAKFDKTLLHRANKIAAHKGISVAEYLSEQLRPIVNADYKQMNREITAEIESDPDGTAKDRDDDKEGGQDSIGESPPPATYVRLSPGQGAKKVERPKDLPADDPPAARQSDELEPVRDGVGTK